MVVSVVAVGTFGAASAQSSDQPPTAVVTYEQQLEQIAVDAEEARAALEAEGVRSCQLTANSLRGLHLQSQLTIDYRLNIYQEIINQANQLAINIESQDQSAAELRSAIAELSDRVTDFTTSYSQYRAEVLEAANIACNGQTELRAVVSRALSALRTSQFHAERVADFAQDDLSEVTESLEQGDE